MYGLRLLLLFYKNNVKFVALHLLVSEIAKCIDFYAFVYRDGTGWPASLPYIRKIHISMHSSSPKGTYGQNMGIHKKGPKLDYRKVVKIVKVQFHNSSSSCCCCCSSSSVSTRISQ